MQFIEDWGENSNKKNLSAKFGERNYFSLYGGNEKVSVVQS